MAIGAGAAGEWAATNATTATVTLPAHAAGDMLLVFAGMKATDMTIHNPQITTPASGWTRTGVDTDGSINAGNGTGSVCQAIFHKEAASSSETNPVITWGGGLTATPGIAVALCFTKGAGEAWVTPVAVFGFIAAATSISQAVASDPGITAGDWGVMCTTTRDNSALTVPSWSATGLTLDAVVEFPATAIATATSFDMAGDAAYRAVTAGTSSAAPVITGTQTAGETGVVGFVRLRVVSTIPRVPRGLVVYPQLLAH